MKRTTATGFLSTCAISLALFSSCTSVEPNTLTPEEIAEADFKNYDTSSVLLGTDLYEFSAGSVSNDIKGKDGTINTLAPNEYKVHSTIKYGKYPSIFNSDTVIKTSGGKRATLVADYSDDVHIRL